MELLPSDVARLVLGYLSDTCPAVAAQFLAVSPDLAEVRRMRPHTHRPFGPSLEELLTEHATAASLVEDVDSTIHCRSGIAGSGDFLYKLRRLLSIITEAKKDTAEVPSDPTVTTYRQPGDICGGGGVLQGLEAATPGQWTATHEPLDADDLDEAPAVGGDHADTPAGEAAVGRSPGNWTAVYGSSLKRKSPYDSPALENDSDSPALVIDSDSPVDCVENGETRPDRGTVMQTELTSATTSLGKDDAGDSARQLERRAGRGGDVFGRCLEKPGDHGLCGNSRDGTFSDSGGDRPATPKEGGTNRRKSRPPRRSDPEKLAALDGNSTSILPVGWIYGQVRHCPVSGQAAVTSADSQATQRSQQRPERSEPGPSGPVQHNITPPADDLDATPPSPAADRDRRERLPASPSAVPATPPSHPSSMSSTSGTRPPTLVSPSDHAPSASQSTSTPRPSADSACPAEHSAAAGRKKSARKKSAPRRLALSECGTTVVRPGAVRRSPVSRGSEGSGRTAGLVLKGGGEVGSQVGKGGVVRAPGGTGVQESDAGTEMSSGGNMIMESPAKKAKISELPSKEDGASKSPSTEDSIVPAPDRVLSPSSSPQCNTTRPSTLPSPHPRPAGPRSPSPAYDSFQSPARATHSSPESSPSTSLAGSSHSSPPDADSSDAFSPPLRGGGGSFRALPSGNAGTGASPSLSQISGRSSQLSGRSSQLSGRCSQLSGRSSRLSDRATRVSERSTPRSQRSLRICLTPVSGKTPSVNGSLLVDETPTSARQSSRCGALRGGRSGSGRVRAPRRRLLAEMRRPSESPQLPSGISRPSAQSTPSAAPAVTAARCRDVAGIRRADRPFADDAAATGRRRTPGRSGRGTGTSLTSPDPSDGSGLERSRAGKRRPPSTSDPSPSPPVKIPSDSNNKSLLKSINIMSFLSRIHSVSGS